MRDEGGKYISTIWASPTYSGQLHPISSLPTDTMHTFTVTGCCPVDGGVDKMIGLCRSAGGSRAFAVISQGSIFEVSNVSYGSVEVMIAWWEAVTYW